MCTTEVHPYTTHISIRRLATPTYRYTQSHPASQNPVQKPSRAALGHTYLCTLVHTYDPPKSQPRKSGSRSRSPWNHLPGGPGRRGPRGPCPGLGLTSHHGIPCMGDGILVLREGKETGHRKSVCIPTAVYVCTGTYVSGIHCAAEVQGVGMDWRWCWAGAGLERDGRRDDADGMFVALGGGRGGSSLVYILAACDANTREAWEIR